jgi:hypothetical protein
MQISPGSIKKTNIVYCGSWIDLQPFLVQIYCHTFSLMIAFCVLPGIENGEKDEEKSPKSNSFNSSLMAFFLQVLRNVLHEEEMLNNYLFALHFYSIRKRLVLCVVDL